LNPPSPAAQARAVHDAEIARLMTKVRNSFGVVVEV
jgi:hypothetical protein